MMTQHQSIYDQDVFFQHYLQLRNNPRSINEMIEKPTMYQLLPDLKGKKVLDLGCGFGSHLQYYLTQGATYVVGIDLSQNMLQQAQNELSQQYSSAIFKLYHLSMENLDQIAETDFDVITSSFAFHYIENFPHLLSKIWQKLKPNGQLIFSQEHPIVTCYQGGERWLKNENKQQIAYRLSFYRDEGERQRSWFKQSFKTYHRTIATIINNLIALSFQIEQIIEPMLANKPEYQQEFKDLQHRHILLFVKSKKK